MGLLSKFADINQGVEWLKVKPPMISIKDLDKLRE